MRRRGQSRQPEGRRSDILLGAMMMTGGGVTKGLGGDEGDSVVSATGIYHHVA